jgi:hypothetical protein
MDKDTVSDERLAELVAQQEHAFKFNEENDFVIAWMDARDELSALRELQSRRALGDRTAPDWQPIETAPKNTAILVYSWGYDVAHFNTLLNAWVACWDHRKLKGVTHWQPLPDPPAVATDSHEGGDASVERTSPQEIAEPAADEREL